MSRNGAALFAAIGIGTIAQLGMVLTGHEIASFVRWFPVLGIAISTLAGLFYGLAALGGLARALSGGAFAGGACALMGIVVSYALGDVAPLVIALGTISSTMGGAIGGAVGRLISRVGESGAEAASE